MRLHAETCSAAVERPPQIRAAVAPVAVPVVARSTPRAVLRPLIPMLARN